MSHSTFVSLVSVIQTNHSPDFIKRFIEIAGSFLTENFDHHEIVLAINGLSVDFDSMNIDPEIRKNCYVLEFAHHVLWDSAVMAGLQRANGDFVVQFDLQLADQVDLVEKMYDVSQTGIDIVYARGGRSWANLSLKRRLFYRMLNFAGRTKFDEYARPEFLISRRALNWITQNRASSRFINESLFETGFDISPVNVDIEFPDSRREPDESNDLAWSALLRSTSLPASLGKYSFLSITLIAIFATADALLVRFCGFNLFLQEVDYIPGWAFLILLISWGFVLLSAAAYAILRSIYIVIDELQTKPPYIVKRFGRL